jgi:hypothetical protein
MKGTSQVYTPKYKFNLYFEDALGSKDSIVIIYDSLANGYIDPSLGEIDITDVPFNEIFEVRGGSKGGGEDLTKIVAQFYKYWMCTSFPISQYQSINIHAKHFPVTMRWDSSYFEEECIDWTHLTRNWNYLFAPSAFSPLSVYNLKNHGSFTFDKNYLEQTYSWQDNYLHSVEGGGMDTIWVFWLGLSGNIPTNAIGDVHKKSIKIYPNPANDIVQIEFPEDFGQFKSCDIFDLLGKKMNGILPINQSLNSISIDVKNFTNGIYFIKLTNKNRQTYVDKLNISVSH